MTRHYAAPPAVQQQSAPANQQQSAAFSDGGHVVEAPAPSPAPAERRASLWFWGLIAIGALAIASRSTQ